MQRWIVSLVLALTTLYLAGCAAIYSNQAQMIVPPFEASRVDLRIAQVPPMGLGARRLDLAASDGVPLGIWHLPTMQTAGTTAPSVPLVMLFLGNAEEPSYSLRELRAWFPHSHVVTMNYRGQGLTGGAASEAALFADALQAYDAAIKLPGVDASRVYVFGRSLGTGIAVYVATQRPVARMVLVSPYDSIRAVAQSSLPLVPVGLLLRHPFDSLARAPHVKVPTLFAVGGIDTLIPPIHSQRLHDSWGGPKEWALYEQADHNSIYGAPGLRDKVAQFLFR
jgi:uncharacterized protein